MKWNFCKYNCKMSKVIEILSGKKWNVVIYIHTIIILHEYILVLYEYVSLYIGTYYFLLLCYLHMQTSRD